jgi:hypothetical protein
MKQYGHDDRGEYNDQQEECDWMKCCKNKVGIITRAAARIHGQPEECREKVKKHSRGESDSENVQNQHPSHATNNN